MKEKSEKDTKNTGDVADKIATASNGKKRRLYEPPIIKLHEVSEHLFVATAKRNMWAIG